MRWLTPCIPALAVLSVLLGSGCSSRPGLEQIEQVLARELAPATVETQLRVVVGRPAVYLARLIGNGPHSGHNIRDYLSDIHQVEVAAYQLKGLDSTQTTQATAAIARLLKRQGWEVLVKASEPQEMLWVVYRAGGDVIEDLYVIALDKGGQLVLVKVDGRLDRIIARALEDRNLQVNDLVTAE